MALLVLKKGGIWAYLRYTSSNHASRKTKC